MTAPGNTPPPADSVGKLVRSAGARSLPDSARLERARRNVHTEWRADLARRRRIRWLGLLAAAVACMAIWIVQFPARDAEVQVASVTRIVGGVQLHGSSEGEPMSLSPRRALFVGDWLETSNGGRALLRWLRNANVRIDSGSAVRLSSASELELVRGAVYIETLSLDGPVDISVSTPAGRVSHIGTQFEVRIDDGNVRVRVRDGAAVFSDSRSESVTIQAGEQLLIAGANVTLGPGVPATDPSWAWTREVAPNLEIEGQSLFEVLDVLGQESGLRIVYESSQVRAKAQSIRLHGQLSGLSVQDTIKAILAGSGLDFVLHPDRVEIHAPRTD